jgi:hypothetical protein
MDFWLSGSLSHKPFSFFTMEFWLPGSLSHEFFFHMVESRLSRSLFTIFSFTWWNLGYQGAFSQIFLSHGGISAITEPFHDFFLSHAGISAITEPFHEFFFHMVHLGYHIAFSRMFLSHGGISAITEPFREFFFHMVESWLSRSLFTNFSFTWWNS